MSIFSTNASSKKNKKVLKVLFVKSSVRIKDKMTKVNPDEFIS